MDSENEPHICYYDVVEHQVKYTTRIGKEWFSNVVSGTDEWDQGCSIAVDSDDQPLVAFSYFHTIKLARWNGSEWEIETVDEDGYLSEPCLVLDSFDRPRITYINSSTWSSGSDLRIAWWNDS